jgi:y4mF family transcriptional regulator
MENQTRPSSIRDNASYIGKFVRQRRVSNSMTQANLGELAGTGTRLISEIERGKPTLRLDSVNAVLAVFGKQLGVVDMLREQRDK